MTGFRRPDQGCPSSLVELVDYGPVPRQDANAFCMTFDCCQSQSGPSVCADCVDFRAGRKQGRNTIRATESPSQHQRCRAVLDSGIDQAIL